MQLTELGIRTLKPPKKGQKLYRDTTLAGFGCRVSQGGTKTFVLVRGKERQFITLGRYPIITLAQARAEAKRLLAEFTLGRGRPKSLTYDQAVELFLADKANAKRERTVSGYKRLLARLTFKSLLTDINPHEASRKLDRITAPSERSHTLVAAKVFWNWCIKRKYTTDNPFTGLSKPPYLPRNRVLTDDELRLLWLATEENTNFNRMVRLCLLTLQRRGEIEHLTPANITGDICTLQPSVTKNGRKHTFPLGPMALALIKQGTNSYNNWGDAKAELDKRIAKLGTVAPFTIHDLRRTGATKMAGDLKVPPHVVERLLNNITGSLSAIALVYNQAAYLDEMKAAILAWENKLQSLCSRA